MSSEWILGRREFLKLSAAAALVRSGGWKPGLQLYTLGLKGGDDFVPALKQIAAIGYREVELPETYDRSASNLRQALDAANLTCPAIHVSPRPNPRSWDLSGDLSNVIADMQTLGARYAVASIPYLPDRIYQELQHPPPGFDEEAAGRLFGSLTADDWKRTAELLNAKGAVMAKAGLRLAHHNHGMDFVPLPGGTCGYQMLVAMTDPRYVDFELDIGWAVAAGQNMKELFGLLGKRLRLLHLKDTKRKGRHTHDLASTDLGTGIVNWPEIKQLVRGSQIEHLFVEQEAPFATTPLDAAKVDYRYLTQLWGGEL